jgi:uncharacterized protein YycO
MARHYKPQSVRVVGDKAIEESDVMIARFAVADVDDPDIVAEVHISEWQNTEAGQWVFEHCVDKPYWVRSLDIWSYAYQYRIMARLRKQDQTFFELKFQ